MTTTPQPQGLPPLRDLTDDERQFLHYNPNTSDLVEFVQAYAREALAAQAATLEAICKIIECAGPEAADEIADLLGYPSVEWPSDQAASVEPVGEVMEGIQTVGFGRKEVQKFVQFDQSLPVGTKLYASAPPSPASVQDEALVEKLAKRTCEANADSARFTIALQTLRASLDPDDWMGSVTMHNYIDAVLAGGSPLQQHPAPSPAQAVDAVGEPWVVFDSQGYYAWHSTEVSAKEWCEHYNARSADDPLKPYVCRRISECAALQASRQPQAQQGVAAPLELKVCHSQNASQTPQTGLSLMAAPQERTPAYTCGQARQSAPVAATSAMVPMHSDAIGELAEKYVYRDFTNDYLQVVDDLVRDVEAHHGIGLTVGDGAQPIKDTP